MGKHKGKKKEVIDEDEPLEEDGTYAGKDAIPDITKDPKYSTLNSMGKQDVLKKLQSGGTVSLEEEDEENEY